MDWLLTLAVLYLFASIFNRSKGKKPKQEPPQNNESQEWPLEVEDILRGKFPFEIPDLEGAPVDQQGNKVSQDAQVYHENTSEQEDLDKLLQEQQQLIKRAEKLKHRKEEEHAEAVSVASRGRKNSSGVKVIPALNSRSALRNAIVYSEILGKPKSLR